MEFKERLKSVVDAHRQQGENSCVPCSAEFILKLHGKLEPDEHPLQTSWDGKPYGYGEVKQELAKAGIAAQNFELDFPELEKRAETEFANETPLVFSWPTLIGFHPALEENDKLRPIYFHMHTAIRDKNGMHLIGFGDRGFLVPLCGWGTLRRRVYAACPAYKIDVLTHRLA